MKKFVTILIVIMSILFFTGATTSEHRVDWTGNGNENAELTEGFNGWHWILTPGGNNEITEATIFVKYGSELLEVDGYRPSGGDKGAMHFDVYAPTGSIVSEAWAVFNQSGELGNNVLTISNKIAGSDVIIEPPVVEPPVIEPPVIEPPVVEPPVVEPPIIEPPAVEPPVIEPPTEEPVEPPTVNPPVKIENPKTDDSFLSFIHFIINILKEVFN